MRASPHRHRSGLVEMKWIGECPRCGAQVVDAHENLARAWEVAHATYGCSRPLVLDESGRGWRPAT